VRGKFPNFFAEMRRPKMPPAAAALQAATPAALGHSSAKLLAATSNTALQQASHLQSLRACTTGTAEVAASGVISVWPHCSGTSPRCLQQPLPPPQPPRARASKQGHRCVWAYLATAQSMPSSPEEFWTALEAPQLSQPCSCSRSALPAPPSYHQLRS
jgi:hypothetical protein